jgi:hypothetical protein
MDQLGEYGIAGITCQKTEKLLRKLLIHDPMTCYNKQVT